MAFRRRIASGFSLISLVFLSHGFVTSCATQPPPTTPPENYKGPVAERPIIQQGDYWVYERGNLTRAKSGALAANIGFPLWVGKQWSYEGGAVRAGQPATSPSRIRTTMDCHVVAFNQITVTAGAFGAYECECRCTHLDPGYEPGCGQWTIWYAPDVKNVIKIKTGSTESSMELIEYRAARSAPSARPPADKAS